MNIYSIFYKYKNNQAIVKGDSVITYEQLLMLVKGNGIAFQKLGYQKNDKVILYEKNQKEFIISFFTLLSIGCWVIPVQSSFTQQECEETMNAVGAKVAPELSMENRIPVSLDDELYQLDMHECGILHMTSGTTGKPKYCVRTLYGLVKEGESFQRTFSITETDRFMSLPPLSHSFALGAVVMAACVSGSVICATSKFQLPAIALREIESYKVTFLVMVPFMGRTMLDARKKRKYDLSSVRVPLVGAGAITESMFEGFYERFGIYLMSNYGSTETGGLISRIEPQPFASIGKPLDGMQIKILNDKGEEAKAFETGEVWVKSPGMFIGYYKEKTDFSEDGFYSMGDLAEYDEDRNIFIKGRTKWLLKIGGKQVNPIEVEQVIAKHPAIKECTVIGIPRENKEDLLVAFYVGEKMRQDELIKHCVERVNDYKVPKRFVALDEIPKNKSGKADRKRLLEDIIGKKVQYES